MKVFLGVDVVDALAQTPASYEETSTEKPSFGGPDNSGYLDVSGGKAPSVQDQAVQQQQIKDQVVVDSVLSKEALNIEVAGVSAGIEGLKSFIEGEIAKLPPLQIAFKDLNASYGFAGQRFYVDTSVTAEALSKWSVGGVGALAFHKWNVSGLTALTDRVRERCALLWTLDDSDAQKMSWFYIAGGKSLNSLSAFSWIYDYEPLRYIGALKLDSINAVLPEYMKAFYQEFGKQISSYETVVLQVNKTQFLVLSGKSAYVFDDKISHNAYYNYIMNPDGPSTVYTIPASLGGIGAVGSKVLDIPNTVLLNTWFRDHAFVAPAPQNKKELDKTGFLGTYAKITPVYNFAITPYEQVIADKKIAEGLLPNVYVSVCADNAKKDQGQALNMKYSCFTTLNGALQDTLLHNESQFFEAWTETLPRAVASGKTNDLVNYRNLILSSQDVALLQDVQQRIAMFPMYVHVEFTTEPLTEFMTSVVAMPGLCNQLMTDYANLFLGPADSVAMTEVAIQNEKLTVQERNLRVKDWQEDLDSLTSKVPKSCVLIGENADKNVTDINDPKHKLHSFILKQLYSLKYGALKKKHARTLHRVFSGETAYSETLFYRVTKYDMQYPTQALTNFFIPNTPDLVTAHIFDTQVKYGKKYLYKIYAYKIVLGTKYQYENLLYSKDWDNAALFANVQDSTKIFEVPYYEIENVSVIDCPPVPPEIEIIPFKNVDSAIKIWFNAGTGTQEAEPTSFSAEEAKQIEQIRLNQDRSTGPIRFNSDDAPLFFEVYRSKKHPKTYKDLEKVQLATSSGNVHVVGSGGDVLLSQVPNTKYWYIFRAIDQHGHISNPTAIYQVELVNDGGLIYPLIKTVEFAKKDVSPLERKMKRFIRIRPSAQQAMISVSPEGKVKMGKADVDAWNRTFKLKVRSEHTGKEAIFKFRLTYNVLANNLKMQKTEEAVKL
jgi:hypothetical protein